MICRVNVLPGAEADIDRLVDFLMERDLAAALRAHQLIRRGIESLDISPGRGRPTNDPNVRELVLWFGKAAYVVRYRIGDGEVTVAGVWHSREP
ncbi:type II toxin-antitoxin system RelE/ParE family toxin [Caulobacter sp. SLTY]|uniref:type II toxin-antitoxin system RelE/ParE family toxin n=1 Tax=Caulobacter sp. SLTY TaxID=2683262 RepID=UPI001413287E|nr:type II toxin-antitoxin system RelE/ParE family toxin [Caulobacter sp. SLTY]NBB16618.1 type II toxin-antitoxin system RelE/ParE family toxin [Caulobacter sp. SLTY]